MRSVTRRRFLQFGVMGGAGLLLGARVANPAEAGAEGASDSVALHPLIQVRPDGGVVLFAQNPDMGQGVKTSLPMILAEELDVAFEDVEVRQADWLPGEDLQFSGGSLSIRLNYRPLRQAGAAARRMLLQAAAERWKTPVEGLRTERGHVVGPDARAAYGELAAAAARLPVPDEAPLKADSTFTLVGCSRHDVDLQRIVTGAPLYSLDLKRPGMLYAAIRRSPVSDGQVASFDDAKARSLPGVRDVRLLSNERHGGRVILPNSPSFVSGVAVLADDSWTALQGAQVLDVQWRLPDALEDTDDLYRRFHSALDGAVTEIRRDGDPARVVASAQDPFEAVYQLPLLAHAPMEPMNCTAQVTDEGVEVWAPTQNPGGLAEAVARALSVEPAIIRVHVLRSGGAFGRRYYSDFAIEAALLARETGRPVKVVWPREDDLRHGYFRPAGVHRVRAALDGAGRVIAWQHRLAGHSRAAFLERDDPPWDSELDPYTFPAGCVPNLSLEHAHVPSRVPLGQWRAISASANVFVVASVLDELAHRAGDDPTAFFLRLLGDGDAVPVHDGFALDTTRLRGVIHRVIEAADWRQPRGWRVGEARHGRGFAACYDQGAWVAEIAEVSVRGRRLRVDRVVAVVDCGRVINPQGARAQVEGAILDGLGAALAGEITLRGGVVQQGNFNGYRLLRMDQAPAVEVHFVDGPEDPRGLGEPPLPPLAPAVCNALFAATGRRIRRLPLSREFEV